MKKQQYNRFFTLFHVVIVLLWTQDVFAQVPTWQQVSTSSAVGAFGILGNGNFLSSYSGRTIYVSTDKGVNWSSTATIPSNRGMYSVSAAGSKAYFFSAGVLYAGTGGSSEGSGVYRSIDNGKTFSLVSGLGANNGNTVYPVSTIGGTPSVVFIAYPHRSIPSTVSPLYRSTDNGQSWNGIKVNYTLWDFTSIGNQLFAAASDSGVVTSLDNGLTWSTVRVGIPNTAFITSIVAAGAKLFAVDARINGVIYVSSDMGRTWRETASRLPIRSFDVVITGIKSAGSILYVNTNNLGGIFRSNNDGQTWVPITGNLPFAYSINVIDGNLFATHPSGLYRFNISTNVKNQQTQESNLSIYPNPVSDKYLIKLILEKPEHIRLDVLSIIGTPMESVSFFKSAGEQNLEFNTTLYSSGSYIARITSDKGVIATKLFHVVK
jgi:Secretion system C-terminal sorting domain